MASWTEAVRIRTPQQHPSQPRVIDTWCRFLVKQIFKERNRGDEMIHYRWLKLNIFARWNASTKEHIIISFIAKLDTRNLLMDHLNKTANTIHPESPRSVYDSLAQLVVELQEDAVWSIRDAVRDVETSRAILIPQNPNPKKNFCSLHDLARHAIHVSETLDLAAQTLQSMIECHGRLAAGSAIPLRGNQDDIDRNGNGTVRIADQKYTTYNHLRFYQDAIEGLRSRSIANKDRLQNEIQYSFNLVAQDIARTSNDIARISNGAQQAIQSDSSVMKTIALGTAIFIPMTFVATVFSMSFFVYAVEDSRWKMSGKFWVFWVVALPFTSLTVLASYYYHRQDKPSPLGSTRGSLDHVDLIGMLGVENRR